MSIRKRTQDDVVDYIKNHSSTDGKLTESLMDIANQLGYSNATIHRTLKNLEKDGIVDIIPSEHPTKPNTIVYQGTIQQADDIIARGVHLMSELEKLTKNVHEYIQEASRVIDYMKDTSGEKFVREDIVDVINMPNSDFVLLKVRKEEIAEEFPLV